MRSPVSISSLVIYSPRKRTSVNIVPNSFPATRVSASRPLGDNYPIEFVQDAEVPPSAGIPPFMLKLSNDDELVFTFTFVIRQSPQALPPSLESTEPLPPADTQIQGLTYVYASTQREVENLVTREFQADPNLHKNSNVELVGDYTTGGSPSVTFEWSWRWKPPKNTEDKGGGWRNSCSFVEYDQRNHRLHPLASFSFWVSNVSPISQPSSPVPNQFYLNAAPPKVRVVSAESMQSRTSIAEQVEPGSPLAPPHEFSNGTSPGPQQPAPPKEPIKVDVSCPRPGEDTTWDDGPVFRATMRALELKTGNMRSSMKNVMKKAEQAQAAQNKANDAFIEFIDALKEAASTNANAVQPAIEHYFDKIAREILSYERQDAQNLQKIVVDPLNKLYQFDIKQAEAKKRDFEEESKDYYNYMNRYLGQRQDSVKSKKLEQSDSKFLSKRRNFELKRFDYSSFMQDLSGGRKEQEVLSYLTKYADAQARSFLNAAKKVDSLLPELEALSNEVQQADKEYQYQRREREEKRRLLEKSNLSYTEPEPMVPATGTTQVLPPNGGNPSTSDTELGRADSTGSLLKATPSTTSSATNVVPDNSRSPGGLAHHPSVGSPVQSSKFKGIRDLEERDLTQLNADKNSAQRKEGLLWALNRPGGHVDLRAPNKQGWHKFWIVLDQGKLSEYSNWKQKLDLHMEPIDLRVASVREARNAERRFCFEVITPQFRRVYQATSEEDMNSWIMSINNALQSAVESRASSFKPAAAPHESAFNKIGSILTGKSPSTGHNNHYHASGAATAVPQRRITVGARPSTARSSSFEEHPDKLLQALRKHDEGNSWCADCGSSSKVEWVSINLAIIICIECSGIHRSLGTHISKIRSLTLDITSFTPDIVELLHQVGNRVANMVWEARLEPAHKLQANATREQRLKFITAKYVDKTFIEPISPTLSRYPTPDETLLAAIKRNEIQDVIYALALGASPNLTDKSRGTHAVFLALAAVRPASPSPSPSPNPSTRSSHPTEGGTVEKPVVFPVAELLVQNGAEIPFQLPAFPLSQAAQLYIDHKRTLRSGINHNPSVMGGGHDGGVGPTSGSGTLTPSNSVGDRLSRDREARLQKRSSQGGGKLARTPISERYER
ncbi:PH domain-containing protein [Coniochaeta sp. 2T2.1]|nr:PH domain-containing protein [Coniochaeta sp. 2T2.1]